MKRRKKHDCFTEIEETLLEKILKEIKKMATKQDLADAIAAIQTSIDADVQQDIKVVEAINALIAKLEASGNTDFQAEVDALKAATVKLSSDNAAVQAAVDAAVPPTPQP